MRCRSALLSLLLLAAIGCKGDPAGPGSPGYRLAVEGGQNQYGTPGALLPALRVLVIDARTNQAARNIQVQWRLLEGNNGSVSPATSQSDSSGVAAAMLQLGADTGLFRVEARVTNLVGPPAIFSARAVHAPQIATVSPNPVSAGDTVTITGQNFLPGSQDNVVLFGGMRGSLVSATATQLRAVVPRCLPGRNVQMTVQLGAVASQPHSLTVLDGEVQPLTLARGEVLPVQAQDLVCLRLSGGQPGLEYLFVAQNATEVARRPMPFNLIGLTGQVVTTLAGEVFGAGPARSGATAAEWELGLRRSERDLLARGAYRPEPYAPYIEAAVLPQLGERRTFNVYNRDQQFSQVTAEVKLVSARAIIYQDINAPTGGFTASDFEQFGAVFDDPIYTSVVSAFGTPSDIDGNERIIVLFTPVVNEITPRGSDGYVAGFFYGLDLLTNQSGSNRSELFYSLVPDPQGRHGDPRSRDQLLRTVPPVLAHEFQHMIHFNQRILVRGASEQETLWLSEALAHATEHIVGNEFQRRGDAATADQFFISNYSRAYYFLDRPTRTSLIAPDQPGTIEMRGAAWLFLEYLAGHHGGASLLRNLTQTTRTGVANITHHTGQPWARSFGDWAVALWASGAPDLAGVSLDARYQLTTLPLRAEMLRVLRTGFPLRPSQFGFADFVVADTLPSSSAGYALVRSSGASPPPVHIGFFGPADAQVFAETRPQISVLRVR